MAELYSGVGGLRFQKLQQAWILWGSLVWAEQNVLAYDIAALMIEQVIFLDAHPQATNRLMLGFFTGLFSIWQFVFQVRDEGVLPDIEEGRANMIGIN